MTGNHRSKREAHVCRNHLQREKILFIIHMILNFRHKINIITFWLTFWVFIVKATYGYSKRRTLSTCRPVNVSNLLQGTWCTVKIIHNLKRNSIYNTTYNSVMLVKRTQMTKSLTKNWWQILRTHDVLLININHQYELYK